MLLRLCNIHTFTNMPVHTVCQQQSQNVCQHVMRCLPVCCKAADGYIWPCVCLSGGTKHQFSGVMHMQCGLAVSGAAVVTASSILDKGKPTTAWTQSCCDMLQAILAGDTTAIDTTEGCHERDECIHVQLKTKQPSGDFRSQDGRLWRCNCRNRCNCMHPDAPWRIYRVKNH